ncbi:MAG TPA: hypothetical protein VKT78_06990 [Fimbriimonadaceae bacterium]|nr:hypothetical protein [Fimbriimonadaceae bacterium]
MLSGAAQANDIQAGADVRAFGNNERLSYLNLTAGTALCGCGDLWLNLNGCFSKRTTFSNAAATIAHGGSDVELLLGYRPKEYPFSLALGVAIPNTASRSNETDLTYRASYYLLKRDDAEFSIDSFGAATVSPLYIAGVSGSYRVGAVRLRASAGAPVQGNNSISLTTGLPNRVGLFSLGAEWKPGLLRGDAFTVWITNQLGWTTGMAATPALGGNPGIGISYTVKF